MTSAELTKLKATMPWTEIVVQTRTGGLIHIMDNQGQEVPMFTMIEFVKTVTAKMAEVKEASVQE